MTPLRIFIGHDSRETAAFHVLAHSIIRHASRPVAIIPLVRDVLANTLATTFGAEGSTEFTRTRFLVPYLSGYEGVSIFMDCDMLVKADLTALFDYDGPCAVRVVKHDYTPKTTTKMDGQPQVSYPMKNWSSLMVFNNTHPYCRALTPKLVANSRLSTLHQFQWIVYEEAIGSLPLEWNYLVGEENQATVPPKNIHYTLGGPWFKGYEACDYAADWYAERELMLTGKPFEPHLKPRRKAVDVAKADSLTF